MSVNWKIQDFLTDGISKQNEFINALLKEFPNTYCIEPTREQDINEHVDVIWAFNPNYCCTFDVKGLKGHNRHDSYFNCETTWIELVNVNGKKGWLYGDENYIVFETIAQWIIIDRLRLQRLVEENLTDKTIYPTKHKECFKIYQRAKYNRFDQIIEVPMRLIIENANKIIDKQKN